VSPAPRYNNELLVFSAKVIFKDWFRTSPGRNKKGGGFFFPVWGNLSMTMWKKTQTIPAPSSPEPVLPHKLTINHTHKIQPNQKDDISSMCEALLSLPIAQTRLERSQAGNPSRPALLRKTGATKPSSACPAQPQPFAAAPARFGGSSNLHVPLAGSNAARGKLGRARNCLAAIWLHRAAKGLSKLSSIMP